jgi:hypothetical protein
MNLIPSIRCLSIALSNQAGLDSASGPIESNEERGKAIESLQGADDHLPIGRILGARFPDFPASYWKKNAIRLRNFPDAVSREAMKTMALPRRIDTARLMGELRRFGILRE